MSKAELFERCMAVGGVAVFPADTVYGLACDPDNREAVDRLYLLKRRSPDKPSAVMFFDMSLALEALPELGERTRAVLGRLLPGRLTALVPNPAQRFPLACGTDPLVLGLRVATVELLADVRWPVLQSSANRAGGPDPRRLEEVPELIRTAADLVLDGGELAGTPSTVLDLTGYEEHGEWTVVRHGAVSEQELSRALRGQFHFDPASYPDWIRADLPAYDRLQDEIAIASGDGDVRRILDLGVGTGETARRVLARHPGARLVGLDESSAMVSAARESLAASVELRVGMLEDALPPGPFDLVVSALAVHHLDDAAKADLFRRVRAALGPEGVFVLGDVVVPARDGDRVASLTPGYDRPSPLPDLLRWLTEAGFEAEVCWEHADVAVLRGRKSATPAAIVAHR